MGVNRPVERGHTVIEFAGPTIQPFDITVWPGNVAVGTCRNVRDDFSMCFHETPISQLSGAVFLGMAASILAQFRQSGLRPDKQRSRRCGIHREGLTVKWTRTALLRSWSPTRLPADEPVKCNKRDKQLDIPQRPH